MDMVLLCEGGRGEGWIWCSFAACKLPVLQLSSPRVVYGVGEYIWAEWHGTVGDIGDVVERDGAILCVPNKPRFHGVARRANVTPVLGAPPPVGHLTHTCTLLLLRAEKKHTTFGVQPVLCLLIFSISGLTSFSAHQLHWQQLTNQVRGMRSRETAGFWRESSG